MTFSPRLDFRRGYNLRTSCVAFTSCRVPSAIRYIPPSIPIWRSTPPRGEQWLHEVKFDGWRIQLHKHGDSTAAFTKNGHHHSSRVGWMLEALVRLPVRSLIIDAELVACDDAGVPHYYALHFHSRKYGLCAWAFDLLHHNGRDLRELREDDPRLIRHSLNGCLPRWAEGLINVK